MRRGTLTHAGGGWCRLPCRKRKARMGGESEHGEQRVLGNRYVVHEPIGAGATATVHFARMVSEGGFSRILAVKRLRRELVRSPEFVSALVDEARLASRIRHPNVVAPVDLVLDEGEIFVVMDYVAGASLAELLGLAREKRKRVAPRVSTTVVTNILYALEAAHQATDPRGRPLRIVHRDVSPQNILVGIDGVSRLLDFGVAKGRGRISTSRAGQVKGRLGYTAPELLTGEEPNPRTDIYAAAVVLWEALTGRRLFEPSDPDVIRHILEADLQPPSHHVPKLPSKLDALVMRGLNRAPDARYGSALAFATAIEETVGLASPRRVGAWVRKLAAQPLAERERLLREVEEVAAEGDDVAARQLLEATLPSRPPPEEYDAMGLDPPTEVDDPDEPEDSGAPAGQTMPAPGFDPKRTRVVGGAGGSIVERPRERRMPRRMVSHPILLEPERRLSEQALEEELHEAAQPEKGAELRRAQMDLKAAAQEAKKRSVPPESARGPNERPIGKRPSDGPSTGSSFAPEDIELPVAGGQRFWIALIVLAILIGAALVYRFG